MVSRLATIAGRKNLSVAGSESERGKKTIVMGYCSLIELLGQVDVDDAGEAFRELLRDGVRLMLADVITAEVSGLFAVVLTNCALIVAARRWCESFRPSDRVSSAPCASLLIPTGKGQENFAVRLASI